MRAREGVAIECDRDGQQHKVECQDGSRCVRKVQLPSTISISTRRKVCKDIEAWGRHRCACVSRWVCGWHWQCQRQGAKETTAFNLELHRCQGRAFWRLPLAIQAFTLTLRRKVLERSVMWVEIFYRLLVKLTKRESSPLRGVASGESFAWVDCTSLALDSFCLGIARFWTFTSARLSFWGVTGSLLYSAKAERQVCCHFPQMAMWLVWVLWVVTGKAPFSVAHFQSLSFPSVPFSRTWHTQIQFAFRNKLLGPTSVEIETHCNYSLLTSGFNMVLIYLHTILCGVTEAWLILQAKLTDFYDSAMGCFVNELGKSWKICWASQWLEV